jgi:hypothetical protein
MKLYDVPRTECGTWVRVLEDTEGPPVSPDFKADDVVLFYHCDGMFSFCRNRGGESVHLMVGTEVEIIAKVGEVE